MRDTETRMRRIVGAIEARDIKSIDFLKEAFVCVSIPIVAYGFVYVTLRAVLRIFFS